MNYLKLKQKIYEAIERNPFDRSAYEEMFAVCREYEKIDFQTAHAWNHELRNHISWGLRMTVSCQKFDEAREFDDLMFRSLLFGAQHFFDDYLQAVEYGKPLDKKFYQPRRHYLRTGIGLIEKRRQGFGKVNVIYVKTFMPEKTDEKKFGEELKKFKKQTSVENEESTEVYNSNFMKSQNQTSRSPENKLQEVYISNPNNTNLY